MSNPTLEEKQAGLMQMRINTRLTALQAAQTLMGTPNYAGAVDHVTLLAMAGDIEKYIIDDLVAEAKEAIDKAKSPPPNIIKVRQ
jgi:hypothetical protein